MSDRSLDYFTAGLTKAVKRRAEQQEEQAKKQAEQQAINEKIQQQLLSIADLKAQIDVFKNADNASTTTTSVTTDNTNTLSADEEQYQAMIIQKMKAHIKSKRIK